MPTPDPLTLLRQAVASHQGLGIAAPEVVVCAQCIHEAIPGLMEVLRWHWGTVTITIRKGKLNEVTWLQSKMF